TVQNLPVGGLMTTTFHHIQCPASGHQCELPVSKRQHRCPNCWRNFDVLATMLAGAVGDGHEAEDGFSALILGLVDLGVLLHTTIAGLLGGILSGVILGIIEAAMRTSHQPDAWVTMAVLGGAIGGFLWGFVVGTLSGIGVAMAAHRLEERRHVAGENAAILAGAVAGLGASL